MSCEQAGQLWAAAIPLRSTNNVPGKTLLTTRAPASERSEPNEASSQTKRP